MPELVDMNMFLLLAPEKKSRPVFEGPWLPISDAWFNLLLNVEGYLGLCQALDYPPAMYREIPNWAKQLKTPPPECVQDIKKLCNDLGLMHPQFLPPASRRSYSKEH